MQCQCDCGTQKDILLSEWGKTRSCGCLALEMLVERSLRHGRAETKIYQIWSDMVGRCVRLTHQRFADYGGRGITVCDRWRDFANFYADMGDRPAGRSLDRIDNDRGYSPGNCRWAAAAEQRANRRPQRPPSACRRGHAYTAANLAMTREGKRRCRTCSRRWAKAARDKRSQGRTDDLPDPAWPVRGMPASVAT